MVPVAISLETFEAAAAAVIALRALPRAAAAVQHPTQCFSLHASDEETGDGSSASTEMGSTSADSREQQMIAQWGVNSHADMVSPRGAGMGSKCELPAEEEPEGLGNGRDVAVDCLGGVVAKSWGEKAPDSPSGGCLSLRPEAARFSEAPEDTGVRRCLPDKQDDSYHCGDQPHTIVVPTPSHLMSDMEGLPPNVPCMPYLAADAEQELLHLGTDTEGWMKGLPPETGKTLQATMAKAALLSDAELEAFMRQCNEDESNKGVG